MTLYNQALDTYKAIHGEEPQHKPYFGASDAPFNGISVETVSELCDARKVRAQIKEWKSQYLQLPLPLEENAGHRFLKISKGSRKYKNLWNNAVWIPEVDYRLHLERENPFEIFEVKTKDTLPSPRIKVISICKDDIPSINVVQNSRERLYNYKFVGAERAKIRIPNPSERDLWSLLTSFTPSPDFLSKSFPNWKIDKAMGTFSRKLHDLPEVEYYRRDGGVRKPIFPLEIFHTSHGYPLIFAIVVRNLTLNGTDSTLYHRGVRAETYTNRKEVRWDAKFFFLGEVFKKGDPDNTITERFNTLVNRIKSEPDLE